MIKSLLLSIAFLGNEHDQCLSSARFQAPKLTPESQRSFEHIRLSVFLSNEPPLVGHSMAVEDNAT